MPKRTPICEEAILDALAKCHAETKPNIKSISREFDVNYSTLYARVKGGNSATAGQQPNRALDAIQEKALMGWIDALQNAYINPNPGMIKRTANAILQRSGEDRVVGHSWVYRWIQ
jgi:transposase